MHVRWPILLALVACRSAGSLVYSPIAAPCDPGRVGRVTVEGAPRSAVAGLAVLEGTLEDPARTRRIAAAAAEELRWSGYAKARIDIARTAGCHVELRVAVELGPRYRIAAIDFDTDDEFPAAERLAVIEDALGTVNTVGGVHIEYRLRRALETLERRYHDAGWLDARIGTPVAAYRDLGRVELSIPVDAGQRYRIAVIRALGASSAIREAVLDELGVEAGTWYDGPTLRRGIERARRKVDEKVELRTSIRRGQIEVEAILEARR